MNQPAELSPVHLAVEMPHGNTQTLHVTPVGFSEHLNGLSNVQGDLDIEAACAQGSACTLYEFCEERRLEVRVASAITLQQVPEVLGTTPTEVLNIADCEKSGFAVPYTSTDTAVFHVEGEHTAAEHRKGCATYGPPPAPPHWSELMEIFLDVVGPPEDLS